MARGRERDYYYSAKLAQPFISALGRRPEIPPEVLAEMRGMDFESWVPYGTVHELLRAGVELTGDPDLGIRAAEAFQWGDFGVVDYTVRSSGTLRDYIRVVNRYIHLLNTGADFRLEEERGRAIWRLGMALPVPLARPVPRQAADYLAGLLVKGTREATARPVTAMEVRFVHPRPGRTDGYKRLFKSPIRFGAGENAVVFRSSDLAEPVKGADPRLHAVLHRHARDLLDRLPKEESFVDTVRRQVMQDLSGGNVSAANVAMKLHLSERTLRRRLQAEGTHHKKLVEELRREMAIRHLELPELAVAEIAFLLGFSQAAAFIRAFKRWTGKTPGEYRAQNLDK
jgi:AraC-like DNA-binding protein